MRSHRPLVSAALLAVALSSLVHAADPAAVAPATPPAVAEPAVPAFSFADVEAEARALAAKPYAKEEDLIPPFFEKLEYDQFREIRFKPGMAEWANTDAAFRAQFFPVALFHNRVAKVNAIENGKVRPIPYERDRYDFGKLTVPEGVSYPNGYAGFRLHGEVNTPGIWDEFAVFVGASYFRCVPTKCGAAYGLSARGLAVNTASPTTPEDFPFFKKFWIEKPSKYAKCAVAYALLDSPNLSGAFRFEIWPGKRLTTKVKSTVFIRNRVERLGLAPFSSMFWYGENTPVKPADFRPEVHDSDGLLVEERDGRRHWRPLVNDRNELRHSVFAVGNAKGFGLRQRDLNVCNYEDLEAWYHKRPGVWVEPGAGWPEGGVHLLELPTGDETWDNVVAYWQPARLPAPGESLSYEYNLIWALEPEFRDPLSRVLATRVGTREKQAGVVHYVVDFAKIPGESKREDAPELKVELYGDAKVVYSGIYYNAETRGWRMILDVLPTPPAPVSPAPAPTVTMPAASAAVSLTAAAPGAIPAPVVPVQHGMRAWLERDGQAVSERWDYRPPVTK